MPGYRQVDNSCAAYTLMLALNEILGVEWKQSTAQGLWVQMQFQPAEDAEFAAKRYTNPCRMVQVARANGLSAKPAMSGLTRIYVEQSANLAKGNPASVMGLSAMAPLAQKLDLLARAFGEPIDPQEPMNVALGSDWYASITCLMPSEGAGAMHNVLVKDRGGQLVVYDSNCDELTWNPIPNRTRPGDPVDTRLGYTLIYTGFAVLLHA